ncbi:MAG: LeuD/DmdB family oxidoreductase small subunit [Candidatus Hodarchaeales archaeon]|jgi:3-isopropylmalate/(R)-2-methylmalate dehydratase small subunit
MRFKSHKIWIFPENDINTDVIFPGRYTYEPLTPEEMARHAMEDYDQSFVEEVERGDMIIAGNNFGAGSSREQAVSCLQAAGISCIIAKSFARIYFRNAINQALPLVISPECSDYVIKNKEILLSDEEKIDVDFDNGVIKIKEEVFSFPKLDNQALQIFKAGGLVEYTKTMLTKSR